MPFTAQLKPVLLIIKSFEIYLGEIAKSAVRFMLIEPTYKLRYCIFFNAICSTGKTPNFGHEKLFI